jgi:hypothetical protein
MRRNSIQNVPRASVSMKSVRESRWRSIYATKMNLKIFHSSVNFSSRSLSLSLPHFPVAFIGFETPTKTQVKVDFKVLKLNETLFSKKEKRLRKIHRKKENFNFFFVIYNVALTVYRSHHRAVLCATSSLQSTRFSGRSAIIKSDFHAFMPHVSAREAGKSVMSLFATFGSDKTKEFLNGEMSTLVEQRRLRRRIHAHTRRTADAIFFFN